MATYRELDTFVTDDIKVSVLEFQVPLDYGGQEENTIAVTIKVVNGFNPKSSIRDRFDMQKDITANAENLLVYLQGGPGFPSQFPTSSTSPSFLKPLLDRKYTVVLLDQRGTGMSTCIDTQSLLELGGVEAQFDYIRHFRADAIVHDCERIRAALIGDRRWALLGQSFGGFTSISYASFFPGSLKSVFLTGGLAPLAIDSPDDVYAATFERTRERNLAYYRRFPQDVAKVNEIVEHLKARRVELPNGGTLTVERFRGLGLSFGGSGGTVGLHSLVTVMHAELNNRAGGGLSYATKMTLANYLGFETNVLYFLFQEAIYINGPGVRSDWAADRVLRQQPERLGDMFIFTGEIVEKSMFGSYSQLEPLQPLAEYIHQYADWPLLYNLENLKSITWNTLPIVATVYLDDQYVDYELGKRDADYFEFKPIVTNQLFHNGLRASPEYVIETMYHVLQHGEYM